MAPIFILGRTFFYLKTSAWLKGYYLWRSLMTENRGWETTEEETLGFPNLSTQSKAEVSFKTLKSVPWYKQHRWIELLSPNGYAAWWFQGIISWISIGGGEGGESYSSLLSPTQTHMPEKISHLAWSMPSPPSHSVFGRESLSNDSCGEKRKMLSNVEGQKQLKAPQIVKLQRTFCGWVWFRIKKQEDGTVRQTSVGRNAWNYLTDCHKSKAS